MQSWLTTRFEFNGEYDAISKDYTGKSDPVALQTLKDRSTYLFNKINSALSTEIADQPTADLLSRTGQLQQQIQRLHAIKKDIKVDVESAVARDEVLRSRDTKLNSHKLFLLNRPVRKGVIPYLWVLSVLFIGIGLIIFKQTAPSLGLGEIGTINGEQTTFVGMIIGFITNKMVLGSLLISALIVILFLSLKIAGVFGK